METLLHIHQDQLETNVFRKDTERMYLRVNYEVVNITLDWSIVLKEQMWRLRILEILLFYFF